MKTKYQEPYNYDAKHMNYKAKNIFCKTKKFMPGGCTLTYTWEEA